MLAAQLYTVREFTKTPVQVRETFKKIKAIGYNSVQVSGMGPIDPNELKDILNETELEICVTHVPFDRIINEPEMLIEEHKLWKCNFIGLGMMPNNFMGSYESVKEFMNQISEPIKKIKASGLNFVYHNHAMEFEKYNNTLVMDMLAENKDIGFLVDTYWVQAGGVNPCDFIKQYGERIDIVHLKDMKIINGSQKMAPVGEGNMNWEQIIKVCKEENVSCMAVEHDDATEPFESLKSSYNYLKGKY